MWITDGEQLGTVDDAVAVSSGTIDEISRTATASTILFMDQVKHACPWHPQRDSDPCRHLERAHVVVRDE
jgi:hypothetical protein